jgi:nitrite reductase (NADH) large subunit
MTQKLVIIGAGMASGRVIEQLVEQAPGAYDITLFNAEPRGNYNRIMLSPVLSGEKTYDEIVTHDDDWYAAHGVTCRFGEKVIAIDRAQKLVMGEKGGVPYDKLVIATGSAPFIISVPGKDLPGVISYRDLDDTNAMIHAAEKGGKAVVIGGGLLGLEAAAGLSERGMDVTVLHLMGHLMERQLDEAAGHLLRKDLEQRGITIKTQASTAAITGDDHVTGVVLSDETQLDADLVVMAVGIRPQTTLAVDAGLEVGRGITVNAQMQVVNDPDIYAVGECVEFDGQLFGLVAPLYDQAKVLAGVLLDQPGAFVVRDVATKLKVTGCDLFSAGDFSSAEGREDIVFRDPARGIYKRLVIEGDRLVGAVMYGDTADGNWFFGLIKDETEIEEMRETLIFGPAYQGGADVDPLSAVAALPPEAEICGCNGICKGTITQAIEAGATDLGSLRAQTKASASCGTCTGLVEQLLQVTLGDDFQMPTVQPVCGCTDLTHEDVRRLIKSKELKSQPAVWQELGWKTVNGCPTCRPAVNFYLLADWPVEYQDDPQSRFVNERKHANIQKDGTFSVVPRMWGGITNATELRAIADAADKYDVPTVKVTGGQRIDLLGVKGEDLPHIWADLNRAGLVSGHAYSKGLRTVKPVWAQITAALARRTAPGLGSSWKSCSGAAGHRIRSSWGCQAVRATALKRPVRIWGSSVWTVVSRSGWAAPLAWT